LRRSFEKIAEEIREAGTEQFFLTSCFLSDVCSRELFEFVVGLTAAVGRADDEQLPFVAMFDNSTPMFVTPPAS
jgi:hypothetical protein